MSNTHPLIAYAKKTGISMEALAEKAGCSKVSLHRIINGKQNATVGLLSRISDATGGKVSIAALLPKKEPVH